MKKVGALAIILMAIVVAPVDAVNVTVSDGGLLALEGEYTTDLNETYYGHTLYIKLDNSSAEGYDILVDGTKIGTDKATYTVKESSGDITIKTNPEADNNITVNLSGHEGYMSYLAQYLTLCKGLPTLLGNLTVDLLIWAVCGLPVVVAIGIKIAFWILRTVVFGGDG